MTHIPDERSRKTVRAMSGFGIPEHQIARYLEISDNTLRKHYRRELDMGMIEANAKVAESLFKKATGDGNGAVAAAIFWTKVRLGWSERLELTGANGGPIETTDVGSLELARRIAFLLDRGARIPGDDAKNVTGLLEGRSADDEDQE